LNNGKSVLREEEKKEKECKTIHFPVQTIEVGTVSVYIIKGCLRWRNNKFAHYYYNRTLQQKLG
jgi:hypothetical protein